MEKTSNPRSGIMNYFGLKPLTVILVLLVTVLNFVFVVQALVTFIQGDFRPLLLLNVGVFVYQVITFTKFFRARKFVNETRVLLDKLTALEARERALREERVNLVHEASAGDKLVILDLELELMEQEKEAIRIQLGAVK